MHDKLISSPHEASSDIQVINGRAVVSSKAFGQNVLCLIFWASSQPYTLCKRNGMDGKRIRFGAWINTSTLRPYMLLETCAASRALSWAGSATGSSTSSSRSTSPPHS